MLCINTTVWMHHKDENETQWEKKAVVERLLTSHLTNYSSKTNNIWWTLLEKSGQTHKQTFSYGLPHIGALGLADQQNINYARTLDAVEGTIWKQWMLSKEGEQVSRNSVLSVWLDDDDDIYIEREIYRQTEIANNKQPEIDK